MDGNNEKNFLEDIKHIDDKILTQQQIINEIHRQIGKTYMQIHAEDFEDNFAEYVNKIRDSENEIAKLNNRIKTIKGIIDCPHCGKEIHKNDIICNFCGKAVAKITLSFDEENVRQCPYCKTFLSNSMSFCYCCGQAVDLTSQNLQNIVSKANEPDNQTAAEEVAINKCSNCGSIVSEDDDFCSVCGHSIKALSETIETDGSCPKCGKTITNEDSYCPFCGTAIDKCKTNDTSKLCTMCGAKINGNLSFCTVCGTKLSKINTK